MGQFDNFKSIAILFTGAFLVSFGVIAFLNVEIQSRSNHGVKMRNENLFDVMGRKISEMLAALREKNSYRRSLLYHLFVPDNTTRSSMRKLLQVTKDLGNGEKKTRHNETHRLRHGKKIKRVSQLFLRDKNNSLLTAITSDSKRTDNFSDSGFAVLFNTFNYNNNNNRTMSLSNTTTDRETLKESFQSHEQCYTTNDVLEIIAITCLVNFIFWFLIIFCVNTFTRNPKMWKFNSFESLTSIDSGSEYELNRSEDKPEDFFTPIHSEEVKPSASESQGNPPNNEVDSLSGISLGEKRNGEQWIPQRFIGLSNIFFDTVVLDNFKPVKKKSLVSREKSNKIVNSFSMEDLIF